MKKKYFLITYLLFFTLSCNNNDVKQKELELKEKELELISKELNIEKMKLTKLSSSDSLIKSNQINEVKLNQEFHSGEPGFINDIFVKNGLTYLTVDFVQIKYTGDVNDFYVINENKKLRTFVLKSSSIIFNCMNNTKIIYKNLTNYRNDLIGEKDLPFIFSTENGMITDLNLKCIN